MPPRSAVRPARTQCGTICVRQCAAEHIRRHLHQSGVPKVSIPNDVVEVGEISTNNVTLKVGSGEANRGSASHGRRVADLERHGRQPGQRSCAGVATDIARDTSTFLTLQSGISPDGSVAGAVVDQSSFQLDGGENTNDMDGSMSVYTPSYAGDPTGGAANQSNGLAAGATGVMPTPADSVEEFKVNVAGQGADFNSSAGAQVQIVTKRGSGPVAWHGIRVLPRQQPEREHVAEQFQRHPESKLPLQPLRRRHRRPDHSQENSRR